MNINTTADIAQLPRFSQLQSLDSAKSILHLRYFKKGDQILRQDDPSAIFIIIKSGYIKWDRISDSAGNSIILDIYGPCETPGELAIRLGNPYPASAIAITDGSYYAVSSQNYHEVLGKDLGFSFMTAKCLSDRAFSLFGRVESAGLLDVKAKLSAFLYRICLKINSHKISSSKDLKIPFVLSNLELASAINCRRETISRTIAQWKKSGQLKVHKEQMEISEGFFGKLEKTFGHRETYFGSECNKCKKNLNS